MDEHDEMILTDGTSSNKSNGRPVRRIVVDVRPVTPKRLRAIAKAVETAKEDGRRSGVIVVRNGLIGFISI